MTTPTRPLAAGYPPTYTQNAQKHGTGRYGVLIAHFVTSGAPGGFSANEAYYLFPSKDQRKAFMQDFFKRSRGYWHNVSHQLFELDNPPGMVQP